jgi:hypothetical protein
MSASGAVAGVLRVAAALVTLGAAIAAGAPEGIAQAAVEAVKAGE